MVSFAPVVFGRMNTGSDKPGEAAVAAHGEAAIDGDGESQAERGSVPGHRNSSKRAARCT
ncbi:hypothetical protein SHKM778_63410 [Streptomyces sp. KM77-8]|uniref:Uncharacterized protein n=1 Tax=Streptomyces haneummycinicus TaxID=3074435 RepID=A0AAT9HQV0_9ACTN